MTIFGLGNPTERYRNTKHNVGFMVVETVARRLHGRFRHLSGRCVCHRDYAGHKLVLVKPLLYMNESGIAVRNQLASEPDDFLVICDDMALPFGRLRIRAKGSDGGHKGLGSIIDQLGTTDFPRLRVGIDAPGPDQDGIDYVLEPFPQEQQALLSEVLERAVDACLTFISGGIQVAMNRFNPAPEPAEEAS